MAVNKANGFRAPYRSTSFQEMFAELIRRNGLLALDGTISEAASVVTVPPIAFVQNGLLVSDDANRDVNVPSGLIEPFFLTVSSVTPSNVDNLSYQFAQSPADVSSNEVIVAEKSEGVWRPLPFLSIDGIIKELEGQNISFGRVGPISGLITTINGGNYENSPGELIEPNGRKAILPEIFSTPIVPDDPEGSALRTDRIIYRKADDDPLRIGERKLLVGGTYGFSTVNQSTLDSGINQGEVRVAMTSAGEYVFARLAGFGNGFTVTLTKWSADLGTEQVAAVTIDTAWHEAVDIAIDSNDDVHLVYADNDRNIIWRKLDLTFATIAGPNIIDVESTPAQRPRMALDAFGDRIFLVWEHVVGAGQTQMQFGTINYDGNTVTAPKIVVAGGNFFASASIAVDEDSRVYLAYENTSDTNVYYKEIDIIGDDVAGPFNISGSTDGSVFSLGTLSSSAKKPSIHISDNKELIAVFLQDKGGGNYGPVFWDAQSDEAVLMDYGLVGTDVIDFSASVDPVFNEVNLTVITTSSCDYLLFTGSVQQNLVNLRAGSRYVDSLRNQTGSMIHIVTADPPGTFSNIGTPQDLSHIGPAAISGTLNPLNLNSDEASILVADVTIPGIYAGSRITVAGSSNGNDGVYDVLESETLSIDAADDTIKFKVTPAFPAAETPAAGVTAQFEWPDANDAEKVKSSAEAGEARSIRIDQLETDILLSRILIPGNDILNYIPPGGAGVDSDVFGVYGGAVVDWGSTTGGELTIAGTLNFIDLINNTVYTAVAGGYAMSEGDALYVQFDGITLTPTPQVTSIQTLPWGDPIQVLGFIKGGTFHPHLLAVGGIDELTSGETGTVGEDLPELHRTRLGITNDTTFVAYPNTHRILAGDDHPTAIGKLDAAAEEYDNNWASERQSGFVDRSATTISFDAGTRTFTVTPTGSDFAVYENGTRYLLAGAQNVVIPDTEGTHWIYFDGGTLTSSTTYSETIHKEKALVGQVQWDATNDVALLVGDARHEVAMDVLTKYSVHNTDGAKYSEGLEATVTIGDGSSNTHAQLALSNGSIFNEDIDINITDAPAPSADFEQVLDPIAQLPLFYRDGAGGDWRKETANDYPIKFDAAGLTIVAQNTSFGFNNTIGDDQRQWAQEFQSGSNLSIDRIKIFLNHTGSPSVSGNLFISIHEDNAGEPGTLLGTSDAYDLTTLPASATEETFTFATPVPITSGPSYWFVIYSPDIVGPGFPNISFSSGTGYPTGVSVRSDDAGASWNANSTDIRFTIESDLPAINYYNDVTGPFSQAQVTAGYHYAIWVLATNSISEPVITIMGQREDELLGDAISNNLYSSLALDGLPHREFRPLYRLIYNISSGFSNDPGAAIVSIDNLNNPSSSGIVDREEPEKIALVNNQSTPLAIDELTFDPTKYKQFVAHVGVIRRYSTPDSEISSIVTIYGAWSDSLGAWDLFPDTIGPPTGLDFSFDGNSVAYESSNISGTEVESYLSVNNITYL